MGEVMACSKAGTTFPVAVTEDSMVPRSVSAMLSSRRLTESREKIMAPAITAMTATAGIPILMNCLRFCALISCFVRFLSIFLLTLFRNHSCRKYAKLINGWKSMESLS